MTEQKSWEIVDEMNWSVNHDYKKILAELNYKYDVMEIDDLRQFAVAKREELIKVLYAHALEKTGSQYSYYGVSDDGFWDLTAHIVGSGEDYYNEVMQDPEKAKVLADSRKYVENFEYCFN